MSHQDCEPADEQFDDNAGKSWVRICWSQRRANECHGVSAATGYRVRGPRLAQRWGGSRKSVVPIANAGVGMLVSGRHSAYGLKCVVGPTSHARSLYFHQWACWN